MGARQYEYLFPSEEDAHRFITVVGNAHAGFAFFRQDRKVIVIDPHEMYAREIFRLARESGGSPVSK